MRGCCLFVFVFVRVPVVAAVGAKGMEAQHYDSGAQEMVQK